MKLSFTWVLKKSYYENLKDLSQKLSSELIISNVAVLKPTIRETVARTCSIKNTFFEISQNSQENACARVYFLMKLRACFPVNLANFLRTPSLTEHLQWLFLNKNTNKWDNVFKNGPSKICGRQPLKNLKGHGLLRLSSLVHSRIFCPKLTSLLKIPSLKKTNISLTHYRPVLLSYTP